MDQLYREFGRLLRDRRRAVGFTQDEVAGRIGLSRTSITNIEKGRQHVGLHVLYALADAVGVKPGELLPDTVLLVRQNAELDKAFKKNAVPEDTQDFIRRVVSKRNLEEHPDGQLATNDASGNRTS
jgi:transcriptional regulator with XRE-family HTH domain